ncbi:MAG: hypothetical protein UY31_C0023G0011 [Candidatus Wolfebacteria bacterium GW2011_GWE1_48_7]|nr:MAG: hypothetical protein UX58_C0003G0079 [Candidatus Wolfebacteria bacterium GW2011_GWB2_46_69]KKU54069.1 MAG: hypothetical protein UX76_C0006G0035 [Candidatus Wolfebacteria bacterium GW2011_GWC1_47_103]KKU59256.1 MAG: hypothetical protein UX83_C0006G0026 [Candidatus Wolfebacteria bacterium GW2011_GWE2_47_12]KKU99603.1 MAG: hypothetical protein UY31_C0023G0011 [Candidatus Wolfebacteria bacterium GW2011_GWE1_48_7]
MPKEVFGAERADARLDDFSNGLAIPFAFGKGRVDQVGTRS